MVHIPLACDTLYPTSTILVANMKIIIPNLATIIGGTDDRKIINDPYPIHSLHYFDGIKCEYEIINDPYPIHSLHYFDVIKCEYENYYSKLEFDSKSNNKPY